MSTVKVPKRVRIWALYAFMYVGGPLLWGAWMVFRLELMSPADFVHCLVSPLTLVMLGAFLAANLANTSRAAAACCRGGVVDLRPIIRAHCLSVVAFGILGTFVFLLPLSVPGGEADAMNERGWLFTAIVGAVSGASLVFLVYGYFTALVFGLITGVPGILQSLRRFYAALFPVGCALFVAAAVLSGRLGELTPLSCVLLALPLATTGFLFARTMLRTRAVRGGVSHEVA